MKIVIIEDEQLTASDLAATIRQAEKESEIVAMLASVKEAVKYFRNNPVIDLIFSDIQLGDGLSFEIFSQVSITTPVIFCTAFDEYAINAFKANGIDYILKPFSAESIETALNKYHQFERSFNVGIRQYENLIRSLASVSVHPPANLLINHKDKILPVKVEEIALFWVENEITRLQTFDGKIYVAGKNLEDLENAIGEKFFRVNRQYLVNRKAVVDASRYFSRKLSVNLNIPFKETLTVSKEKTPEFLQWLETQKA